MITSDVSVGNTSVSHTFDSELATGGLTSSALTITPLKDYPLLDGNGRRVLNPATGNTTFKVTATIATSNPDISPILDTSRYGIIAVENIINNMPLSNASIILTNAGSGYGGNGAVTVTVSAPTGAGGIQATANVLTANTGNTTYPANTITGVILTNPGAGYITAPTFTFSDSNTTPGSGATVTYNGEDSKTGGNGAVRYITRQVTLADGFDSGDLRVYLTAYKPAGSDILVYYKLLSGSDPDVLDTKSYQLMTKLTNTNFTSVNQDDYREMTFAPGVNGIANNTVSYTSGSTGYNTFKTFAIKIVLSGTSTVDVPRIRDFRTIALPPGQ